ncbi:hypothetical protein [Pelagicoccus sp. SDUM812002]|uniref:hypothetical protein n=1 Tax=Pelagicoccus sp. SDUM812002 TaxID=3041266 RepID=UPI00280CB426|nr:hypothetical protein [Pelagicoccus sp. SDUM812002]MDQ8187430.1 hypothetical protein [Pelagicoccus sp. SDUM812002]
MKASCLEALNKAFTEAGSRFIVVGGLAVVAHGYLRATQIADIVIELLPNNIERAFTALESLGYKPTVPITPSSFSKPENRLNWTIQKNMTVLQFWSDEHRDTPVDVFINAPFDFTSEWKIAYRQSLGHSKQEIRFASLATLIDMKETASRPQDLVDLEHLRWIQKEESKNDE